MRDHILDELPFFINRTLAGEAQARVVDHLSTCLACKRALIEWEAIAHQVRTDGKAHAIATRPLSPLTWTIPRPRSLKQALQAVRVLVWAQRMVLLRGGLLTSVAFAVLLGVFASASLSLQANHLFAIPLMLVVPCIAVVAVVSIQTQEDDPVFEIIAAAPTPAINLVFARLTLALCAIALLALASDLLLVFLGAGGLGSLIFTWLGPLLVLSGLATFLSLLMEPLVAMGLPLLLWVGIVSLLTTQSPSHPTVLVWLTQILEPGIWLVLIELVCAGLLWFSVWITYLHRDQFHPPLETGR